MTLLEHALAYASKGLPVFPLKPGGKTPLTKNGFKDASCDERIINDWWTLFPDANIGMPTGEASDLVVIDVDAKHGGLDTLEALEESGSMLSETLTVHTGGGGYHFYYKHPGMLVKNRAGIFKGIDVRGDGGYVVMPPSLHESGEYYTWEDETGEAEPLPDWLLHHLSSVETVKKEETATTGEVGPGQRNDYLARVAGRFQRLGVSKEAIYYAVLAENEEKCSPPVSDKEVRAIVESISRYEPSASIAASLPPSTLIRASELTDAMLEALSDKEKVRGTPTGIPELDKLFYRGKAGVVGGKRRGELTAIVAEAKTGKSSLYHFMMALWMLNDIPVGYASREMSPADEVIPNILTILENENAWEADLTPERREKYRKEIAKWPLYFAPGYGEMPLEQFEHWIVKAKQEGVHYFFVDHLHFICPGDAEDYKVVGRYSKELKRITKDHDVHIDLIIQPTKLQPGTPLGLHSIRGGSGIGQNIDNLFLLEKEPGLENVTRLKLDRARSKLAKPGHIYFSYDPDTCIFSVAQVTESPPGEQSNVRKIEGGWKLPR